MFAAIRYGNVLRNVDLWMKEGNLDLGKRGPMYESHVRAVIKHSIAVSKLLKNAGVYPAKLEIPTSTGKEEIDLVLWIGNTILVGEDKCQLFPTEPIEKYRHFETLREAVAQAKRKACAASQEVPFLLKQLGLATAVDESQVRVVPFVLTNQPLAVGCPIDGVAIVDIWVLGKYLAEGYWDLMVRIMKGEEKTIGKREWFYSDQTEASANIKSYLLNPPQVAIYKGHIKRSGFLLPELEEGERRIRTCFPVTELPYPELNFTPRSA